MKTVAYSSPYVPAEWIAAHGLKPRRVVAEAIERSAPVQRVAGLCPYMREFVNTACALPDVASVVLTTVCDQMRRAADLVALDARVPLFLFNVPSTWQTPAARGLYRSELRRFGRFLEVQGGSRPTSEALAMVMAEFDAKREALRSDAAEDPRRLAERTAAFPSERPEPTRTVTPQTGGIPVALLGGPLSQQSFALIDTVGQHGGTVVLDGTETGKRGLPRPFDRARLRDNPVDELVDAYFGSIPDVARRPNDELYRWLERELSDPPVRGVILVRWIWCDLWHAETERLREWLRVPLLDLDLDGEDAIARNRTRVQAFMESIR